MDPHKRKGSQGHMARSLSVFVNNKDRRIDSFFRVIPSTPRVKEGDEIISISPPVDPMKSRYVWVYASVQFVLLVVFYYLLTVRFSGTENPQNHSPHAEI
ncbi:hypothetical protein SAY87_025458 [Trapa incisa]|uniref:Uncharacterized protein n=1 Tax=Trapa incisa TaxID=236973 RepID=A0AAN7GFW1_9MYRT|nr:hypothetical protein SAY87_025458 [Trapa incisa]